MGKVTLVPQLWMTTKKAANAIFGLISGFLKEPLLFYLLNFKFVCIIPKNTGVIFAKFNSINF